LSLPAPEAALNGTASQPGVKDVLLRSTLRLQSDEKLVELLREGFAPAFDVMVERYRLPLTRYCARMVGPDHADDIVQETFTASYSALGSDDRPIQLKPWLYRVAHNTAISALRKKSRHDHEELDENVDGVRAPHDQLEQSQRLHDLVSNMRALPERQRAAIVLQELEGMSPEEIAQELDGSVPMVRQLVHRARERLRNGVGMLIPLPLLLKLFSPSKASAATGKSVGTAAATGKSAGATFAGVGLAGSGAKLGIVLTVGVLAAGGVAAQKVVLESGTGHPGKEMAGAKAARDKTSKVDSQSTGHNVSKADGTAVAGGGVEAPTSENGETAPTGADRPAADADTPGSGAPDERSNTDKDPSPAPQTDGNSPSSEGGSGSAPAPATESPSGAGGGSQPSSGSQPSAGGSEPDDDDAQEPDDGGDGSKHGNGIGGIKPIGGEDGKQNCKPVPGLPRICLK
jgi:RNA polymerase sigma factor (sigma-70 family)